MAMRVLLYLAAAALGLVAGAYTCLGVVLLAKPGMGWETALAFILPSGATGAVLLPWALRAVRRSRRRRNAR
jgi:hypothetical protein